MSRDVAQATIGPEEFRAEFAAAFDRFDARPKLVVDADLHILWACDDAHRLLDGRMPLCIRDGKLVVDEEALRVEFLELVHAAGPEVQRKLVRGKAERNWAVVRAWKPDRWDRAVCLQASPSLPVLDIVKSGLAREFRLTQAEVRVLKEFAELNSPKQIASDLGLSLSTVRSHLKQIHAKASVTTSQQLLRLTHSFCSA
jgi:DNA-binding CsgD family transcriptional regulator